MVSAVLDTTVSLFSGVTNVTIVSKRLIFVCKIQFLLMFIVKSVLLFTRNRNCKNNIIVEISNYCYEMNININVK